MGGTIMGSDPSTSVVNEHGQAHDIENLVISGPGTFPTGAAVNPTLTQVAWTLRSAEHLVDAWSQLAGPGSATIRQ
jgi:choline dehydrogenase-like flavoprotein